MLGEKIATGGRWGSIIGKSQGCETVTQREYTEKENAARTSGDEETLCWEHSGDQCGYTGVSQGLAGRDEARESIGVGPRLYSAGIGTVWTTGLI